VLSALIAVSLVSGCSTNNPVTPVIPLPPLSAVVVTPPTDTVQVGQNSQFSAAALDTLGALVGNASFSWSTTSPTVATVNQTGRVTGVSEGVAQIIAEAGGKRDTAIVSVYTQSGWYTQISNTSSNLNGVFFQPDGRTGWAVGDGGRIVKTSDAGNTWAIQTSNTSFNLQSVWFTSATEGWVVGNNATVLHTLNGGTLWSLVFPGASENLQDVTFATRDTGWAVGSSGVVLGTFDRGANWSRLHPTASTLHGVSFSGTRDGWAVGDAGVIVGTHDRGLSWYVVQPSLTAQSLRGVWRRSSTLAWAVGGLGVTPRTVATPDSALWELQNAGSTLTLEDVNYPTNAIGYVVGVNSGGSGTVLRTDDGGLTWEVQNANTQFHLNGVFFTDPLHGWAVGNSGAIIHTARGGLP
jgi:photosystem II stability/assembly factor-like uncharacterized protein